DGEGTELRLIGTLTPQAIKTVQDSALKQNITTLHNRINELGVSEPVIQQQGADRVVVQMPGVPDTAQAKKIIGRTATLEIRLVDEEAGVWGSTAAAVVVPERIRDGGGTRPVLLKRQVVVTGDQLIDAAATLDQTQQPAVSVTLDARGASAMK